MRLVLLIALVAMTTGCASLLPDKQTLQDSGFWPSQTRTWCYLRSKLDRDKREVYVGIGCRW